MVGCASHFVGIKWLLAGAYKEMNDNDVRFSPIHSLEARNSSKGFGELRAKKIQVSPGYFPTRNERKNHLNPNLQFLGFHVNFRGCHF